MFFQPCAKGRYRIEETPPNAKVGITGPMNQSIHPRHRKDHPRPVSTESENDESLHLIPGNKVGTSHIHNEGKDTTAHHYNTGDDHNPLNVIGASQEHIQNRQECNGREGK